MLHKEIPVDVAISRCIQNLMATYGEGKVRSSLSELFNIDRRQGDRIDTMVLSKDKDRCMVHLQSGLSFEFNFFKLGMTSYEGIAWVESVFNKKAG